MKPLRSIALSALLTLTFFTAITYTACTKDECKSVTCLNGGTCAGGNCSCPSGVGGSKCETIYSDLYAGTYIEGSGSGTSVVTLTPSANGNDFSLMTLTYDNNYGNQSYPIILSSNTAAGSSFNFVSSYSSSEVISGSGTVNTTTITVNLTFNNLYSGTTSNSTITYTKVQ